MILEYILDHMSTFERRVLSRFLHYFVECFDKFYFDRVLGNMSNFERRALSRLLHRLIDVLDSRYFNRDVF